MKPFERLAQAKSPDGTVIELARRDAEYVILAAGGQLMSSRLHGSEESLAQLGCRHLAGTAKPNPVVLIGGLGMGYTLRAALDLLPARATVVVAELIPEIVDWNRGVLAHLAGDPLADPRVRVEVADVASLLAHKSQPKSQFDAILLDVDNGPASFTDSRNDTLYSASGVTAAHNSLNPGGMLAVWSGDAGEDRGFVDRLRSAKFAVTIEHVRARANNKGARHTIYLVQKSQS